VRGSFFLLKDIDGCHIDECAVGIDNYEVTNNQAEYVGLITGLQCALNNGIRRLLVKGDSELVIRQMRGEYRINNYKLERLNNEAQELADSFQSITYKEIPRSQNHRADTLANNAIFNGGDDTYYI